MNELIYFSGFILFILVLLAFDLGILNKGGQVMSFKKSLMLTLFWVCFGLLAFVGIRFFGHHIHGIDSIEQLRSVNTLYLQKYIYPEGASLHHHLDIYNYNLSLEYITGYILEYALSVDNIFVIILVLNAFKVPEKQYHRILFWGILGAVVMRFAFIFLGAIFITKFTWLLYVFGIFLIYSGTKILFSEDEDEYNSDNKTVRFLMRYLPIKPNSLDQGFFVRENGKCYVTMLFVVLIVIEFTDLLFAVDSIPAIYGVTKDPYIIFFSNVFAILGLRSLFFLISSIIKKFQYLQKALSLILIFIGLKMILELAFEQFHLENVVSLFIIIGILALGIIVSLLLPSPKDSQ